MKIFFKWKSRSNLCEHQFLINFTYTFHIWSLIYAWNCRSVYIHSPIFYEKYFLLGGWRATNMPNEKGGERWKIFSVGNVLKHYLMFNYVANINFRYNYKCQRGFSPFHWNETKDFGLKKKIFSSFHGKNEKVFH